MNKLLYLTVVMTRLYFTECSEESKVMAKSPTCGLSQGGPMIQKVTRSVSYAGGVAWNGEGQRILFADRFYPALCQYTPGNGELIRMELIGEGQQAAGVFPVKNQGLSKFVVAIDRKLSKVDVSHAGGNYEYVSYSLLTVGNNTNATLTKGKVDNSGRLWIGAVVTDGPKPSSNLYKITDMETPVVMLSDMYAITGLAWNKNYDLFYVTDTYSGLIYRYEFNGTEGTIDNPAVVFNVSNYSELGGSPYDVAVDDAGYLWIGMLKSGAVLKFDPVRGTVLDAIAMPAANVVSVEFGGFDLATFYVGTSKYDLDPKYQPGAGDLFAVSGVGAAGILDNDIVIPSYDQ